MTLGKSFVVYLLHFESPVSGKQHYCGIAATSRLDRRLRQHASATGARLTARAARQGVRLYLAHTWETLNPALETRIKRAGHLSRHCPYCSQGVALAPTDAINSTFPAPHVPPRATGIGWSD